MIKQTVDEKIEKLIQEGKTYDEALGCLTKEEQNEYYNSLGFDF